MKKRITVWFLLLCILVLAGCGSAPTGPVSTVEGNLKTYYEMADGTWQADGRTYKHRLEVSGTMPNAQAGTTFIYLSNLETISFEQAWMAAGFSSNLDAYFSPEEAMLVEMNTSKTPDRNNANTSNSHYSLEYTPSAQCAHWASVFLNIKEQICMAAGLLLLV